MRVLGKGEGGGGGGVEEVGKDRWPAVATRGQWGGGAASRLRARPLGSPAPKGGAVGGRAAPGQCAQPGNRPPACSRPGDSGRRGLIRARSRRGAAARRRGTRGGRRNWPRAAPWTCDSGSAAGPSSRRSWPPGWPGPACWRPSPRAPYEPRRGAASAPWKAASRGRTASAIERVAPGGPRPGGWGGLRGKGGERAGGGRGGVARAGSWVWPGGNPTWGDGASGVKSACGLPLNRSFRFPR